eukprot:852427-Pleurochrysis_carterae.AAC.1
MEPATPPQMPTNYGVRHSGPQRSRPLHRQGQVNCCGAQVRAGCDARKLPAAVRRVRGEGDESAVE